MVGFPFLFSGTNLNLRTSPQFYHVASQWSCMSAVYFPSLLKWQGQSLSVNYNISLWLQAYGKSWCSVDSWFILCVHECISILLTAYKGIFVQSWVLFTWCMCVCFEFEEGPSMLQPFPPLHRTFLADGSDGERDVATTFVCPSLSSPWWPFRLQTLKRGRCCCSALHLYHRLVSDCKECFVLISSYYVFISSCRWKWHQM